MATMNTTKSTPMFTRLQDVLLLRFQISTTTSILSPASLSSQSGLISGLQDAGLSIVRLFWITPTQINIPPTTGSEPTHCKCSFLTEIGRLQNGLIWKSVRALVASPNVAEVHNGYAGVKVHENSVFLYKSHQAQWIVKHRALDYAAFGAIFGFIGGVSNFLFLPAFYVLTRFPRYLAEMYYFTFHAELLPHTEQVVFLKVNFLG